MFYSKNDWNKFHLEDVVIGLKKIEDESVDIIIVDPPYNINKNFGLYKDDLELDNYLNWCDEWINECIRIMKSTGSIYIYGFSEILAHLSVRVPLNKRWLIWHYTNKTVPGYNGWQRSHESILYCWKNKPIFNKDVVRVPYTKTFIKNSAGKIRKKSDTARYGKGETIYNAHAQGALPRDVFTNISTLAGGAGKERYFLYKDVVYPSREIKKFNVKECLKHPTQKPSKLTRKLILSSKPQDGCKVVIPFAGSGSEGVVCKRMGIDFIGFDNNEQYIKLADGALEQYKTIF